MAYSTGTIANYFLRKGFEANIPITHLKLQKLVYFAHGWHLAIYKKPLIDEVIEAWPFGPVICSLYHIYKIYGKDPIDSLLPKKEANQSIDEITKALLDKVWETYGRISSTDLANMTHTKDGPWYQTWIGRQRKGAEIQDNIIMHYFSKDN
ncbi:MAG: SocA family protein [Sedimentisphaerales bacterium]|nr:SocA family protein [Sedimentisphaerales bacterium]